MVGGVVDGPAHHGTGPGTGHGFPVLAGAAGLAAHVARVAATLAYAAVAGVPDGLPGEPSLVGDAGWLFYGAHRVPTPTERGTASRSTAHHRRTVRW